MTLTADQILAADDLVTEPVDVPEWGGSVNIKTLTGTERDDFEKSLRRRGEMDLTNYRARFLVRVLVTDGGARLFTDKQAGDLGKKSSAILGRLWEVASNLNGMGDDQEEAAEGNSELTDGDASSSSSPGTSAVPEPSSFDASAPES